MKLEVETRINPKDFCGLKTYLYLHGYRVF